MEFNKSTTAFLACHWQNDVVGPDGAFTPFYRARMEEHGVIHVARRLIDSARRSGVRVVYARVAFAEAHRDLVTNIPLLSMVLQQQCLLDGTPATEIIDELEPQAEDWVITNTKVSAFASSDLDERLRGAGIDTVVLFGVATNLSVESTGRAPPGTLATGSSSSPTHVKRRPTGPTRQASSRSPCWVRSRPPMRSSPRYEHEWLRIMIEVRIAPVAAAQDTALVNELAALVNGVYALAEEGLWVNGTPRTTPERMAELMAAGQIAIAWADERIVGAIRIQRLDTGEGEFGMLVADPAHRGHGVGRELVRFAEHWSREQGLDTMQLEVLVPRQWSHPSKEFLTAWYARIGYRPVRTGPLEESYPELAPLLATPCDFVIYHKSLRTLPNDDALLSV